MKFLDYDGLKSLITLLKNTFALKSEIPSGGGGVADSVQWDNIIGKPSFAPTTPATTNVSGLMSSVDKTKLDGIESGANNYTHPSTHPASIITGLSTVAISGSYNDLSNKPDIPICVVKTKAEYDALTTKDANTYYFIKEG